MFMKCMGQGHIKFMGVAANMSGWVMGQSEQSNCSQAQILKRKTVT